MTFDISELNLTAEPEHIEPDAYVAPWGDTDLPIDKGMYASKLIDGKFKIGDGDTRTPVRFGKATSKKNGQSYLMAEFAIEVDGAVQGKPSGKRFVYGRVDAIPEKLKFDKVASGRENANSFRDLLVAYGYNGRIDSWDDYQNALIALVDQGAMARSSIDKDAFCNPKSNEYAGCGNSIKGEDSFTGVPTEPGQPNADIGIRVVCNGNHPTGQAPILLGRNTIKRTYPTKKGA